MPLLRPELILASASTRRRELLRELGLEFATRAPDVAETARRDEPPEEQVRRLAREKAIAVHLRHRSALVLAADTLVVMDGDDGPEVLGKPADPVEARSMLRRLSGREHRVLTGVALASPGRAPIDDVGLTRVQFLEISQPRIDWYVGTGEPMDKAGAYGIQGRAALFVERIQGSWSNVVGLPVERLPGLFERTGRDLFAYAGPSGRRPRRS